VPSLEKFSGGITPSQTVPVTLQHSTRRSTIITPSTLLENVMRKPRDFDGELKALQDKARDLKSRKVQQLGELVIATGADSLSADELAGALIAMAAETKDTARKEAWAKRGVAFFQSRGRSASQAIDLPSEGVVKLGRLFKAGTCGIAKTPFSHSMRDVGNRSDRAGL
jgi:hypothetical protein